MISHYAWIVFALSIVICVSQVREAATQHATIVSLKLRTRFENLFLKDAAGIRRRWGAKDDIQVCFVTNSAKLCLLRQIFVYKPIRAHFKLHCGIEIDVFCFQYLKICTT